MHPSICPELQIFAVLSPDAVCLQAPSGEKTAESTVRLRTVACRCEEHRALEVGACRRSALQLSWRLGFAWPLCCVVAAVASTGEKTAESR